jgi:hypothetical protein
MRGRNGEVADKDGVRRQRNTYPQLNIAREELDTLLLEERALHVSRRNNPLLTMDSSQQAIGHLSTSKRHTERRAPCTILGLDDLIAAVLNPINQFVILLLISQQALSLLGLRQQRDDSDARVTTDDGHFRGAWVCTGDGTEETGGAHDVQGGDTEEASGVEGTSFLEYGGADRDGAVYGVGDD